MNRQADRVVITDVQIPFGSMVILIIKALAASLPALLILSLVPLVVISVFGGLIATLLPGG